MVLSEETRSSLNRCLGYLDWLALYNSQFPQQTEDGKVCSYLSHRPGCPHTESLSHSLLLPDHRDCSQYNRNRQPHFPGTEALLLNYHFLEHGEIVSDLSLPSGQGWVLHSRVSSPSSAHWSPPPAGSGLSQCLSLLSLPPSQEVEHSVQAVQSPHPPSTLQAASEESK